MHINPVAHISLFKSEPYVCLIKSEFNYILILRIFMGFGGSCYKQRFQNISLTLSIITVKYINAVTEINIQRFYISVIF